MVPDDLLLIGFDLRKDPDLTHNVEITAMELVVTFKAGETIHTEIAKKYALEEINQLAEGCGFEVVKNLFDNSEYFTDSIWKSRIDDK